MMKHFFAASLDFLPGSTSSGTRTAGVLIGDILLVVAAALVLALVLFLGVKYLYKGSESSRTSNWRVSSSRRRRGESGSSNGSEGSVSEEEGEASEEGEADENGMVRRRKRRRRQKRDHRPRNPTLAETGGLPPERNPQTPPQ